MTVKASTSGAFVRGMDASTGLLLQPKGSVPRASNFVLTKRGSLRTCDGTGILAAFNGAPISSLLGKTTCDFLYSPVGVMPYFLHIMALYNQHLGAPTNLAAADGGSGGSLSGAFFYVVTAIDGVEGQTPISNEVSITVSAGHKVNLTWNVVPNAVGYYVYRGTSSGTEQIILLSTGPDGAVPQPLGATSVSFTDTGYATQTTSPPTVDTTQQTGLFVIPYQGGSLVSYGMSALRALWPATYPNVEAMSTQASFGNVSLIPQIVQFVNEAIIALGNSYPPQVYSDPTSPDNQAVTVAISSITIDAYGFMSVLTAAPNGLTAANVGANVLITSVSPSQFNGVFQVLTVPAANQLQMRNLSGIGHSYSSGGELTVTTIPLRSTFSPDFASWVASTAYALNSIVQPTSPNGYYYQAISPASGGESFSTEPTWPVTIGATVQDGNITWQCSGTTASAAPPPPGAAHLTVYAGALWAWDTSATNTANGLDGPCCLRMSDVNEPNSWNPVNTAFLDKDDGSEGQGLVTFTITAQGIPPEGSLVACKNYATYQIVGVFGSANFAIQRVVTDMGCTAPRTLQFVPGYGIGRITHLGVGMFDGVADRLISPQVVPFLFPSTDPELADIVPADPQWLYISWSCLTANPTMYCLFIPSASVPGNSEGALTTVLCFDLVLKAWVPIFLPFPVSTALQAKPENSNPITCFGSYSDGTLQRWQAGDVTWATSSAGSNSSSLVTGSFRTQTTASKDPEERLYCRRTIVIGQVGQQPPTVILIQPRVNGVSQGTQKVMLPKSGRFAVQAAVGITSDLFDAIVTVTGDITIDACSFDV